MRFLWEWKERLEQALPLITGICGSVEYLLIRLLLMGAFLAGCWLVVEILLRPPCLRAYPNRGVNNISAKTIANVLHA